MLQSIISIIWNKISSDLTD